MTLVETADVVIENFRPDVKDRLGIDYASLAKVNQRIILASVSGFGQDGPYRAWPGVDQIAQGMSGLMSVTGAPGGGPMRVGAAICDMAAGLYSALGVMTAIIEREKSGLGQWVHANLVHAGIGLMDFQAARFTVEGEVPQQVGNDHPTGMPTSAYTTADGYINIGAAGDGMWARICKATGRDDLHKDARFVDWNGRSDNRVALNAELNKTFKTRRSAEWIDIITKAGVPCGPIYTMDQTFADPQVKHLGIAEPVRHPRLGEIKLIKQVATLSRTPASMARATAEKGEHTDEVLQELGYSASQIAELRERQAV
jgi:crotonobetainyl-CoA:carnitine CoA-transferase CaiB-like acyl-CoA transferase